MQVTNVGTLQVANSITAFIPGASAIPRTVASFTPAVSTVFWYSTTNYASGGTSQIGAETVVSSGLIHLPANLRPQSAMANQGTQPAVISSHPFPSQWRI